MRYHSSLTKQYISINDTPENIAKHLILKTCEVEETIVHRIPAEVVIGKVTATSRHPQADKLMVCQVNCGDKGNFQICTGGENVVADSFVPVAIPGCYLPVIDLKIEPRKLRGEDSNGMICSKGEIGILEDEEQHWIWTLQYGTSVPAVQRVQLADFDDLTDADCGMPLGQKYPWLERYIFDVDNKTVTHRPDLTGHFGLAWELNAIYGLHDTAKISWNALPKLMHDHTHTSFAEMTAHAQQHTIEQHITCPGVQVYSTILVEGCTIARSSLLTRMMLIDCGSTPKHNWVDFSNYVMLLTGQPIHTFDADTIVGSVQVRYATHGEQFTDLKGIVHSLIETDIVIADDTGVLALGGVMGGERSMVTEKTKRILIEVAHFDGVAVRKTGTRLGLRTDAELRYEKNINPHYTMHAVTMVLDAMTYMRPDLGAYTIAGLRTYTSPDLNMQPKSFPVVPSQISAAITGDLTTIAPATMETILTGLGFGVLHGDVSFAAAGSEQADTAVNHDLMTITVPRRRSPSDINGQHDIVEEIVRVYGYENVVPQACMSAMRLPPRDRHVTAVRAVEEALIGTCHYDQCESYPWLHSSMIELLAIDTSNLYQLQNPLAPETQFLRDSMLPGLLDIVQKNMRFHESLRICDIGKIRPDLHEQTVAGMIMYTTDVKDRHDDPWLRVCQDVVHALRVQGVHGDIAWNHSALPHLHSKKQATLSIDGMVVARIGQIHPRIHDALKLPERGAVVRAEVEIAPVIATTDGGLGQQVQPRTNQDHIITRDVCFVCDTSNDRSTLMQAIENVNDITNIRIFDIYAGDKLPAGKKSLACRYDVVFAQAPTSEQITDVMQRVIAAGAATGAVLR